MQLDYSEIYRLFDVWFHDVAAGTSKLVTYHVGPIVDWQGLRSGQVMELVPHGKAPTNLAKRLEIRQKTLQNKFKTI